MYVYFILERYMKRFVFFFICMVQVMFSYAQYCCTQKGQKFYYNVQYDGKLTETYASVVNVENSNSSYIITMGNPLPAMNEQLKDTLLYKKIVYSQDNTLVYLQDKDNEEANIYSMLSGIMDEKDIDKINDKFSMDGEILITLNDHVKKGDKMPSSKLTTHIGPLSIKTSMKGRYGGFENLSTPAGEFNCIKVNYTLNITALFISETVDVTAWYAKGIGLVKEIEKSEKTNKVTEKVLSRIEQSSL